MKTFQVIATDDGWRVIGDIDVSTGAELSDAFGGEHGSTADDGVVVDVAEVTFIDSSGLRVLIELVGHVGAGGVTIRGASQSIRRLLELTGLTSTFRIEPSPTD